MPIEIIYITVILISYLMLLFIPKYGFFALRKRVHAQREKKDVENALKHLYMCEQKSITCQKEKFIGLVELSMVKTEKLLKKLVEKNLVKLTGNSIKLTDDGKQYALHIIRSHRLWETYLAEETGLKEEQWHIEAERMEHKLSKEQADLLAAKLGLPLYDPHGDPIPAYTGELPEDSSRRLTDFPDGVLVHVVHVEDEPVKVYQQLVSKGIKPGVNLRIFERTGNNLNVYLNDKQLNLSPEEIDNISVKQSEGEENKDLSGLLSLDKLQTGIEARVKGISYNCRGQQRKRLMDLGIIPGSVIKAEFKSASGDPVAYSVKGATIALRRSLAKEILIEQL